MSHLSNFEKYDRPVKYGTFLPGVTVRSFQPFHQLILFANSSIVNSKMNLSIVNSLIEFAHLLILHKLNLFIHQSTN